MSFIAVDFLWITESLLIIIQLSVPGYDNNFVFASEIKALFEFPGIEKTVDKQGICELFGIGPAHTAGFTTFKNIYELKPAHFAILNKDGYVTKRYWKLHSKPHTDSFGTTCQKVEFLLNDAITRQLVSDVPLCTFLSGGLDSSIISKFAPPTVRSLRRSSKMPCWRLLTKLTRSLKLCL